MRILSVLLASFLILGLVGCKSAGVASTQPLDPLQQVQLNADNIRTAATVTTATILLTLDVKDQAEFGQFANQTAAMVYEATAQENISLQGVKAYARDIILRSDTRNKVQVGILFNSLSAIIERNLQGLQPDKETEVARVLLQAVAGGVLDATQGYAKPVPATQPTQ
jgi:hypothetical protein